MQPVVCRKVNNNDRSVVIAVGHFNLQKGAVCRSDFGNTSVPSTSDGVIKPTKSWTLKSTTPTATASEMCYF